MFDFGNFAEQCQDSVLTFLHFEVGRDSYPCNLSKMAAPTALQKAPQRSLEEEELTDEQIDELLSRATDRLKAQSSSRTVARKDERRSYTYPKLQTGQLDKPYVSKKGDVASVNASRSRDGEQQTKANGIRIVQNPATIKKLAEEVRAIQFFSYGRLQDFTMRKSFPKYS